jgi:hypothetical protein
MGLSLPIPTTKARPTTSGGLLMGLSLPIPTTTLTLHQSCVVLEVGFVVAIMELFSKVLLQQQQPPHLILCSHVSWRPSQRTTAAFTFLRHVQQQCSEKLAFRKSSHPLLYAHESSKNRERKEEEEEEQKKKKKRKKWRRRGSAPQVVAESLFGHGAISGQEEVESRGEGTWTTYDSSSLYRLQGWGAPYFVINSQGHLCVRPSGSAEGACFLLAFVERIFSWLYFMLFVQKASSR